MNDIESYGYSTIFEFEGDEEYPTIIHLIGKGMCPKVKIS